MSTILLSIYSIKILALITSFWNRSRCAALRVIAVISIDILVMFVIDSSLFLISLRDSNSRLIFIDFLLMSYYLVTSFLSVLLSFKSSFNSSCKKEISFKVLDSSLLELVFLILVIFF